MQARGGTHGTAPIARSSRGREPSRPRWPPPGADLETDALALADYGDPPGSPVLTPLYAWRVFKRQRELKAALAVRMAEAEHARTTLDDALVALAERARPAGREAARLPGERSRS